MNHQNINDRIERYIAVIEPINEGRRNHALHNAGLLLRKNFGLTVDALESALSEVNQTKCSPPLTDSEVTTIARSVDRSDAPIGEGGEINSPPKTTAYTGRQRNTRKAERRTVYSISQGKSVSINALWGKPISLYADCFQNTPHKESTLGKVVETFQVGGASVGLIDAIRNEPDKSKRDELKKRIPAVVFGSEPQAERKITACTPNGILCLDFDNIPSDELESAKKAIAAVPYIFAAGLSVSGRGLFALAHYEGTPDLKKLLPAMQADFRYEIDKSRSDLCGLRYVTWDIDIIIKDDVSPAILTETTEPAETDESASGSELDKNDTPGVNMDDGEDAEPEPERGTAPKSKSAPVVNQFSLAKGTDEILRTEYPDMRWIVEGLIPEGQTILAGKSKAGKSWLMLQLCLAVAKGQSFLGFNTVKTKAVYLALEDSERRIKSRIKFQQQSGSANLKILDRWKGGLDALVRDLPGIPDVKLIVIDTWGRFIGKLDGNDYHEVTEKIGRLHDIAKEHGIAVIVCTHTKKGMGASDWLDDVIGSTALVGCADTILKFSRERNSDEGSIDVTGRDVHEQSIGIRRDEHWRWWVSDEQNPERRAVKEVLRNGNPEGMTERSIKRLRPNLDVEGILRELLRDGEVESNNRGKTTCYRLTVDTCAYFPTFSAQVSIVNTDNTPESGFSTIGEFDEFAPPPSSESPQAPVACPEKPEGGLADLADTIRETFDREPGKNVVPFSDILSYFDGDRVPASAFLNEYGFAVDDDGQVVNAA
ncbi:MAG: AAA family ATPase [Planctomycetaceae bacterium]|jgi:hypothetical protein|nr:AAA family ATPase [Planctomycetaceae bacterium]